MRSARCQAPAHMDPVGRSGQSVFDMLTCIRLYATPKVETWQFSPVLPEPTQSPHPSPLPSLPELQPLLIMALTCQA